MLQPQTDPGFVAEAFVVVGVVAQTVLQHDEAATDITRETNATHAAAADLINDLVPADLHPHLRATVSVASVPMPVKTNTPCQHAQRIGVRQFTRLQMIAVGRLIL